MYFVTNTTNHICTRSNYIHYGMYYIASFLNTI